MELKKADKKTVTFSMEKQLYYSIKEICKLTDLPFVKVTNYLLFEALKRYNEENKK
jgi:hypothetical protein